MGSREGRGSRSGRHKGKGERQQQGGPTIPLDEVVPLAFSKERWVPTKNNAEEEKDAKEVLCRKVNGLLNKLTLEKFESISDKIIELGDKSTEEKNGSSLQTIIQLIFEKATDEPNFIMVYASLCRKMMDKISPDVMDEGIRGKDNKPVAGGALFRKYLLSRCQEEFEKGWKVNLPDGSSLDNPNALLTDEYYIAAKAKRRGLGLMAFIGELFKLQMLTERIMHECIKRLLSNVQTPEEEETESLCKLMTTVGKQLDRKEAKNYMDAYFQRMKEMSVNKKLNSRIRFMLLDVIDLRSNKWVPRREVAGPKTISQIHQDAQKQK
ncbi:ARM repeat-containing protein, partial [Basidiobolus meristosporus CBS 931.73]